MRIRKGQVSLEFLLVFGVMLLLLLYSVGNVTFKESSPSTEMLRVQIVLEEKNLANAVSTTISQVYSQGPGAKATSYVRLTYLRDSQMLTEALGVVNPRIFITYGNYSDEGNGTYVTVTGIGAVPVLEGGDKNVFWSRAMYQAKLYENQSLWSPRGSITIGLTTVYGIEISPEDIPSTLKIVVEWDPDSPESWNFDSTKGELRINIKPGG